MIRKKMSRRKFLIYPHFQWAILSVNFAIIVFAAGYLAWSARAAFGRLKTVGVQMHLFNGHPFFKQIDIQATGFYNHLFIGLLVALIVSTVIILIMTQKITGPVLRMRAYLDKITNNEKVPSKPLNFRKGDYFQELPHSFNGAVIHLRSGKLEDEETTTSFMARR